MKIQIRKDVHEQLTQRAKANKIEISDLANSLLEKMLNHHHEELSKIIEKVKMKK